MIANDATLQEQLLRVVFPACYALMVEEVMKSHIHAYDIRASVAPQDQGYLLILRYGEGWTHREQRYFEKQELLEPHPVLRDFFGTVAESCKQMLIRDYFKLMKP